MNKSFLSAICAVFAMSFSLSAFAVPVVADFSGSGGFLGTAATSTSLEVNGVTATAFYLNVSTYDMTNLYQRNNTNDSGIGVCSGPEQDISAGCAVGGGDVNELSNQTASEVILLDKGTYATWEALYVSSLDSSEAGELYWGDSNLTGDALIKDLLDNSKFAFKAGDAFLTGVNGNVLDSANNTSFVNTSQYVLFVPGGSLAVAGNDNDYLVWKAAVSVPAPAVLGLMSIGLLGVGAATKRRNRKH